MNGTEPHYVCLLGLRYMSTVLYYHHPVVRLNDSMFDLLS